jgi:AcrR family transcriptional regulator
MARPPNADADATRLRIREVAGTLFAARGIGSVSVRQIAAEAGVSLAMIHHYFGSKDALYGACVDAMYAELEGLQAELAAALVPGGSLEEIVERAVRTGFRFARAHRIANRLLWRQVVEAGTLDEARRARYQQPFLKDLSLALAAASGRPAAQWRLPVQSLTFLISRYALSEDSELSFFTEGPEPAAEVEEHLVSCARLLLGLSP